MQCPSCEADIWPSATECVSCGRRIALLSTASPEGRSGRQPYRYGWFCAWAWLSGAFYQLELVQYYGLLALFTAVWIFSSGLAAVLVHPWGWFLLLVHPLGYLLGFFIIDTNPIVIKLVFATPLVAFGVLSMAYFYRRRVMFGATWRWSALERRLPRLVGPERWEGPRPGFFGLSWRGKLLFAVAILLSLLLGLLDRS